MANQVVCQACGGRFLSQMDIPPMSFLSGYTELCPLCHKPTPIQMDVLNESVDHKYRDVYAIDHKYRDFPSQVTEEIRAVTEGFVRNVDSVVCMARLPSWTIHMGLLALLAAENKGTGLPPKEDRLWIWMNTQHPWTIFNGLQTSDSNLAIRAMFSMMVVGAWTAYEVLAEDLWVTILNGRPRLAFVAINAEIKSTDTEKDRHNKRNKKFQIPSWMLEKYPDFKLKEGMGTLLREQFDFGNREDVEDAYRTVFRDCISDLNRIFGDEKINWVVATRNVIVHDAGRATNYFRKLTASHPQFGLIDDGELVILDGMLVRELVEVVIEKGKALLDFASTWLKNNAV